MVGMVLLFMIGSSWIFVAGYARDQLFVADICSQVNDTLIDTPPKYNTGFARYLNCFSSVIIKNTS